MNPTDWPSIRRIYEEGIATGIATLDTQAPDWFAWDESHLPDARIVAEGDDVVLGWAALAPSVGRCSWGGVAEVSVYVAEGARGKRVGNQLLEALITESEAAGFWTLQSQIFAENTVSIRLHESVGFRTVGVHERIGHVGGRWRDVVVLERRSSTVGVD